MDDDEDEDDEDESRFPPGGGSRSTLHQMLRATPSFKVDEDPEVVRHLVQTLGLIGTGDSLDLNILGGGSSHQQQQQQQQRAGSVCSALTLDFNKERRSSFV